MREERLKLAKQYSNLCKILEKQNFIVVIATISMFKEIYELNVTNFKNYYEIYLKVPLEELRRRDPKNIYSDFDNGKLKNIAGLDIKIDEPKYGLTIEFDRKKSVAMIANEIINYSFGG